MMCGKRLAQSLALKSAQLSPILEMHTAFLRFAKHLNISMLLHTVPSSWWPAPTHPLRPSLFHLF